MTCSLFWPKALRDALTVAGRGLPVFPLASNKLPALRSPHQRGEACLGECGRPGHGVHDATTDRDRIRALFHAAGRATGYGIACNRAPVNLIGLDLDRKNGVDGVAALRGLAHEHGFAIGSTVTVSTPSGGLHLWLLAPAGTVVPNSASRIGPGIDVRGQGGYLAGPGSWTPRGEYRLCPGTGATVAPVPPALLRLMLPAPSATQPRQQTSPVGHGDDDALVRFVRDAPRGQLNNRLFWAACRAYEQAADPDTTAEQLLAAAIEAGHPERGAARTIASARTRIAGRATR
ncbi:bifunctional DNA primase/polymerase [Streptomyces sp. NPDC000151]|uniref:bifunctional DNA primase/polymerase n=1 Tax=Streptomyces sp. NPDC000151 TaxID=3154244 RepID=UPI0033258B97